MSKELTIIFIQNSNSVDNEDTDALDFVWTSTYIRKPVEFVRCKDIEDPNIKLFFEKIDVENNGIKLPFAFHNGSIFTNPEVFKKTVVNDIQKKLFDNFTNVLKEDVLVTEDSKTITLNREYIDRQGGVYQESYPMTVGDTVKLLVWHIEEKEWILEDMETITKSITQEEVKENGRAII